MDSESPDGGVSGTGRTPLRPVLLFIALLVAVILAGVWYWKQAAGAEVSQAAETKATIKAKRSVKTGRAKKAPAAAAAKPAGGAGDSARRASAWVPMPMGREDRGYNLWVAWEDPQGDGIRKRARDLSAGFVEEPGRLYIARRSWVLVHPSVILPDSDRVERDHISLPQVLSWFAYDPFQEWTLHSPAKAIPFRPTRFRLVREPASPPSRPSAGDPRPGKADTSAPASADTWSLWAQVPPGALFVYRALAPDAARGNGYADRAALALGPVDTAFGREHFENLLGGRVDSILLFSLPGRPWRIAEVHGRREGRAGAWIFLVDPATPRLALLAHDLDRRPCPRDKRIRFRAVLDVNGDGRREILLGPKPSLLYFEDGDIFNYLQEYAPPCRT